MGDILLGTEMEGGDKVLALKSLWLRVCARVRGGGMWRKTKHTKNSFRECHGGGVWRHGRIWLVNGKKEFQAGEFTGAKIQRWEHACHMPGRMKTRR